MSGIQFNGCARRSKYRVDCRFFTDGGGADFEASCRLTVIVRGEGERASAKLRSRCRREPVLSFRRAEEAMAAEAERIAEKRVRVDNLSRQSRTRVFGQAFWFRSPGDKENCTLDLLAVLVDSGEVEVRTRYFDCTEPGKPVPV